MPHLLINEDNISWTNLLQQQYGGAAFHGVLHQRGLQRGHGLGAVLATIATFLPKLINSPVAQKLFSAGKNVLAEAVKDNNVVNSPLGRELLSSGKQAVSDIVSGNPVGASFKKAGRQAVRNLTGLGRKRKQQIKVKPQKRLCTPSVRSFRL